MMRRIIFLLCLLLVHFGLELSSENALPKLEDGSAQTAQLLKWAKIENKLCSEKKSRLTNNHIEFQKVISHLKAAPASSIKKNTHYFGDLQSIIQTYKKVLFLQGLYGLEKNWSLEKLKAIKKRLDSVNAEDEFSAPILLKMGYYADYYKKHRVILELFDSKPERLVCKPLMPPVLLIKNDCSVKTLHDIVAIYEICKKNYWNPIAEDEEKILLKIAQIYEKNNLNSYALATLSLATVKGRTANLTKKIDYFQSKLEKKEVTTGDDLY